VDAVGGFGLEIGLLAATVVLLAFGFRSLIILWRLRALINGVQAVVRVADEDGLTVNRATRRLLPAVSTLGMESLGVIGLRRPWDRRSMLFRVLALPDRTAFASIIETSPWDAHLLISSILDDGFEVSTSHPESFGFADDRIDHLGVFASPAVAFEEHRRRVDAAVIAHGMARRLSTIEDVADQVGQNGSAALRAYRRAHSLPRVRRELLIATILFVATGLTGSRLLSAIEATDHRPPGVAWTAMKPLDDGGRALVNDVATIDGRFVAVGQILLETVSPAEGFWASDDGATWEVAAGGLPGGPEETVRAVSGGRSGLIAIGHGATDGPDPRPGGRLWTSLDGRSWAATEAIVGLDGYPVDIADDGSLLVAVGQAELGFDPAAPAADGTIWYSPDGAAWKRADIPPVDFFDAIVGGANGFVALGVADMDSEVGSRTTILHSVDGQTWTESDFRDARTNGAPEQLLAWRDGYVAVGLGGAWFSPDGVDWSPAVNESELRDAWLHGVATDGDVLVAVGERGQFPATTPSSWTSLNGKRWKLAGDVDRARGILAPHHVAIVGDHAIVFGIGGQWSGTIARR
jgi:hypothetical protein